MRSRARVIALATGALMLLGGAVAVAVPVPSPDPCAALFPSASTANLQKYDACRFDRIEKAIPVVTSTVTAPAVTATVTAPAVTVTVTATPPATTPVTTPPVTTTPPGTTTTTPPAGTIAGASNTGVPAGVTLTPYTGPCTITAPTTIDAKTIGCTLVVRSDLTVTRSKVNGQVNLDTDLAGSSAWRVTVTDSEVDAGLIQQAAICCGNMKLTRVNVHGGQTAVQCEELSYYCQVTDSWLHGQQMPDNQPWHLGGFLSDGTRGACTGTNGLCIELVGNTVVCDHAVNSLGEGCTGDINLIPNFATISNVLVQSNYLGANTGSSFCTYGGEKSTSPYPHADHVVYRDNTFDRGTNGKCAAYGPVNAFNTAGVGNVWTGNVWSDGGAVLPAN